MRSFGERRSGSASLSYMGENVEAGICKLVFYSLLPAHLEAYYDDGVFLATLALIGVRVTLNLWLLNRRGVIPGLPAPIFLGLTPLVVYMLF